METVLVDSGYWLALEMRKDQNHPAAIKHWRSLTKRLPRLVTTSYVLDEVATFLNRRGHHDRAVAVGERLLQSPSVDFVHVDETLFHGAWQRFGNRPDKRYSLTDCVSFALMATRKIRRALTFDEHFRQEGFLVEPQRK